MATWPIPGYAAPAPDVPHPEYDTFLRPLRFNAERLPRQDSLHLAVVGNWVECRGVAHTGSSDLSEPLEGSDPFDGDARIINENTDIKEFHLGLTGVGPRRSYRDVKHYRRRKRWLA